MRRTWDTSFGALTAQALSSCGHQYFGVDNAAVTLVEDYTLYDASSGCSSGTPAIS